MKSLLLSLIIVLSSCVAKRIDIPLEARTRALAYVNQGAGKLVIGDLDSAESLFTLAEEIAPIPESVDGLGCVAFKRKEFARAKSYFKQALGRNPKYAQGYSNLGKLASEEGDSVGARHYYQRALDISPENIHARNNFATELYLQDLHEVARHELLKAKGVVKNSTVNNNLRKVDEYGSNQEEK